jgi:phage-related protein
VKPIVWLGDSLQRLRDFPEDAKREAGHKLMRVQAGGEPADWKPMKGIGPGVSELRVRCGGAFRVVYIARLAHAIYVVHAFQKKSRKTSRIDLELARRRVAALAKEAGTS